MKILNLFLFFIQIVLCFGIDLLPNPGQLPVNPNNENIQLIASLNYIMVGMMNPFASDALDNMYNATDLGIIQNLHNVEGNIEGQYNQLSNLLEAFNEKLDWINEMVQLYAEPDPSLELGGNPLNQQHYENLRDRNIHMQNIIILAMNFIKGKVNVDIIQNQLNQNVNMIQHQIGENLHIILNQIQENLNILHDQRQENVNIINQNQIQQNLNLLNLNIQNFNIIQHNVEQNNALIEFHTINDFNTFKDQIYPSLHIFHEHGLTEITNQALQILHIIGEYILENLNMFTTQVNQQLNIIQHQVQGGNGHGGNGRGRGRGRGRRGRGRASGRGQ